MGKRISLSLKQLVVLVLLIVITAVGLTLVVFLVGQRSALSLLNLAGTPTLTSSPTMPPLPKAMTATPSTPEGQVLIITEDEINSIVSGVSGAGNPLVVREVRITSQQVQMSGEISYSGYQGNLEIVGTPYVQNHRLGFQLASVAFDGQRLPEFLYPTVEEQINLFFDQLSSGYDIESVELQDGRIVLMVVPW